MKRFKTIFIPRGLFLSQKRFSASLVFSVLKCIFFFGVLCILTTPAAFATQWNVAMDFSATSNPNGQWSYGWEPTLGDSFTLYSISENGASVLAWYDIGGLPVVWKNISGYTLYGVLNGEVALHPSDKFSVVRWVASSAGQFDFQGSFGQGDLGAMSYYIYSGASPISSWINEAYTATFSFNRTMAKNEAIDFIVGVNTESGWWGYGTTPLDLTITGESNNNPIPEPATMLLLGSGLVGLAGYGRRKFRNCIKTVLSPAPGRSLEHTENAEKIISRIPSPLPARRASRPEGRGTTPRRAKAG